MAWSTLTGNLIKPFEYDILSSMDSMFCKEMNAELHAKYEREKENKSAKFSKLKR